MTDIPRLNGAIRALDAGKPAFVTFFPSEVGSAITCVPHLMTAWCSKWNTIHTTSKPCVIACNTC